MIAPSVALLVLPGQGHDNRDADGVMELDGRLVVGCGNDGYAVITESPH